MSGNKQLDWATATRERFRSWSPTVLHLLHSWLQQHHTCSQVVVQVLSCCTAWVKLGALHAVGLELAEQIAQAGLLCIQSSSEQVSCSTLVNGLQAALQDTPFADVL